MTPILRTIAYSLASLILMLGLYANLPVWLDYYNGTSYAPLIYMATVGGGFALALWHYPLLSRYTTDGYLMWCAGLCVLTGLTFVRTGSSGAAVDAREITFDKFELSFLFIAIAFLVYLTPRKYIAALLPLVASMTVAIITMEFLNPDLFVGLEFNDEEEARVSGFWLNANPAAEVAVLTAILCARTMKRFWLAIFYTALFAAILFTGSRSGMIAMAVVGTFLFFQRKLPIYYVVVPIVIALSINQIVNLVDDLLLSSGRTSGAEQLLDRITFFSSQEFSQDDSAQDRQQAAIDGFLQALEKPVFGHAIPYIDEQLSVGPHNMLVDLFHQYGIFGIIVWLWLAYLLLKRGNGSIYNLELFVFVWFTMFSQTIMGDNWWIIFFAIAMSPQKQPLSQSAVGKDRLGRRRRRRKRKRTTSTRMTSKVSHTEHRRSKNPPFER